MEMRKKDFSACSEQKQGVVFSCNADEERDHDVDIGYLQQASVQMFGNISVEVKLLTLTEEIKIKVVCVLHGNIFLRVRALSVFSVM